MTAASPDPVLRLRSPAEILVAVPHLCGYVPSESLVAVSLRGRRHQVGLTMRLDLPRSPEACLAAVDQVMSRLVHDDAEACVIVVYTETGRPHRLVTALLAAARRELLDVLDVLLVQDRCWWSLTCQRADCCPPAGTPLASATATAATTSLAAAVALEGRAVLASRAELVASLAPPADSRGARRRCQAATAAWRAEVRRRGMAAVRRAAVGAFGAAITSARPGDARDPTMLVALRDAQVRDEVATLALERDGELLAVLTGLAGCSTGEWDPPVCTLVAIVAWMRGDGALANVALDRALAADPAYTMARLTRAGLDAQLPPSAVRRWLRDTRQDLRAG